MQLYMYNSFCIISHNWIVCLHMYLSAAKVFYSVTLHHVRYVTLYLCNCSKSNHAMHTYIHMYIHVYVDAYKSNNIHAINSTNKYNKSSTNHLSHYFVCGYYHTKFVIIYQLKFSACSLYDQLMFVFLFHHVPSLFLTLHKSILYH